MQYTGLCTMPLNSVLKTHTDTILDCIYYAFFVLLPLTGWAAESWLGRYRAILVGLILSAVTLVLVQLVFVFFQLDWTPVPALVLSIIVLVIGALGFGSLYTNMLPFTLDQMIGASAEELSAVVQWYYWGFIIGKLIRDILRCISIPQQLEFLDVIPVVLLVLGSLCLLAVLIMDCLYHKWLDTNDKTGNPIKLIFGVLNYARKNKYPRLRSAFTYIDEEQPSRLDFGKHKFGGPFTEEEVEDVKTIFQFISLLVAALCSWTSVF